MQLTIPDGYGLVLLSAMTTSVMTIVHMEYTATMRKGAKVPYPNPYATANDAATSPEKYRFNCAQKAHAQFNEHHPTMLLSLLISGLRYPEAAAYMGFAWTAGRLAYLLGYARKNAPADGKGRLIGIWWNVPHLGLLGTAFYTAWKMVA